VLHESGRALRSEVREAASRVWRVVCAKSSRELVDQDAQNAYRAHGPFVCALEQALKPFADNFDVIVNGDAGCWSEEHVSVLVLLRFFCEV
jgi:hypothetical protein